MNYEVPTANKILLCRLTYCDLAFPDTEPHSSQMNLLGKVPVCGDIGRNKDPLIHTPLSERKTGSKRGVSQGYIFPHLTLKTSELHKSTLASRDLKFLQQLGEEVTKDLPSHRICL